jgi:hypothetical protein
VAQILSGLTHYRPENIGFKPDHYSKLEDHKYKDKDCTKDIEHIANPRQG